MNVLEITLMSKALAGELLLIHCTTRIWLDKVLNDNVHVGAVSVMLQRY